MHVVARVLLELRRMERARAGVRTRAGLRPLLLTLMWVPAPLIEVPCIGPAWPRRRQQALQARQERAMQEVKAVAALQLEHWHQLRPLQSWWQAWPHLLTHTHPTASPSHPLRCTAVGTA